MRLSIIYSKYESDLFNLRFGRADLDSFSSKEFSKELIYGEYDICRLKVPSSIPNINDELEKLGFPFHFSGAITRYKVDFSKEKIRPYRDPNIEFEFYDGTKYDLFQKLLIDIFNDYPLSFYSVPIVNKLISQKKQQEGVSSYFAETQFNDKNRLAWFVKYKGEYVGILATKTWDNFNHGEGTLSGVIPKYRNSGLFLDIISFIQNYCIENEIKWGHTGARLHEVASHKFFTKQGMYVENGYLVFYISSLLSKSEIKPISKSVANKSNIIPDIIHETNKLAKNKGLIQHKFFNHKHDCNDYKKVVYTFPLKNENEEIIIAKVYGENKTLLLTGHFEYKSFN